ncbi:MAG TPA: CapA family protein, partial [Candidatus Dormibacteraeota bacterium]|nr:CapA family protein [Candidatus Dormibacteraeota bacterium]
FQLTAVADAIMVAPVSVHRNDPAFMGMVKAVRKGDAAVLNVEGTFAGSNAYPIANAGTTWVFTNPDRLQDLQWMGFNLFNAANNHSLDFGVRDLLDTIQAYKQYRAVFAGIGDNLGTARAPAYLETPRGRNVRRPAQNGSGAAAWRGRAKFEFLRAGQASF